MRRNARRYRGSSGLVGWSADRPLAPLGSRFFMTLRGVSGEALVAEWVSSCNTSVKYCSIESGCFSLLGSEVNGTISLLAIMLKVRDATGVDGGVEEMGTRWRKKGLGF